MTMRQPYTTIGQAQAAVAAAQRDVTGDMGEQAWADGYADVVRAIAAECTGPVAVDLCRRWGVQPPAVAN